MKIFLRVFGKNNVKNKEKNKGTAATFTVIGAVLIAAIVVFYFYYIYPLFFRDLFKSIALSSAEIVARDLAGFISVSGVAPNEIKIAYNPSESYKYNVAIGERLVQVYLSIKNLPKEVTPVKEIATAKSAVDNINEKANEVNFFEIKKNVVSSIDKSGIKVFNNIFEVIAK